MASGARFNFLKPYFGEVIRRLQDRDLCWQLLQSINSGTSFVVGPVCVLWTHKGWIWLSRNKLAFKTPRVATIRMSRANYESIKDLVLETYLSCVQHQAIMERIGPISRCKRRPHSGNHGSCGIRESDRGWMWKVLGCGYYLFIVAMDWILQPISPVVKQKPKVAYARKGHGRKTISNHYLKRQSQLMAIIEPG